MTAGTSPRYAGTKMKEVYARGRRVHTGIEGRYGVSHLAALRQGIPASGVDGG